MSSIVIAILGHQMGNSETLSAMKLDDLSLLLLAPVPQRTNKNLFRLPIVKIEASRGSGGNREALKEAAMKILHLSSTKDIRWIGELPGSLLTDAAASPHPMTILLLQNGSSVPQQMMAAGYLSRFVGLPGLLLTPVDDDQRYQVDSPLPPPPPMVILGDQSRVYVAALHNWLLPRLTTIPRNPSITMRPAAAVRKNSANETEPPPPHYRPSSAVELPIETPSDYQVPSSSLVTVNQDQTPAKVIMNPFTGLSVTQFHWQAELTIVNPFWSSKQTPNKSAIGTPGSRSLFDAVANTSRSEPDWSLAYPLHNACAAGSISKVMDVSGSGSGNQPDRWGWTPLHYAAWHGWDSCVRLLLAVGESGRADCGPPQRRCSPNVRVPCRGGLLRGDTPMHYGLLRRHQSVVAALLTCPDLDMDRLNSVGQDAKAVAADVDMAHCLQSDMRSKVTKVVVHLMDQSALELVCIRGQETTLQDLHVQLMDLLDIPDSCDEIFCFWLETRSPRLSLGGVGGSKISEVVMLPCQSHGNGRHLLLRDLGIQGNAGGAASLVELTSGVGIATYVSLWWRRNIFVSMDTERKIKSPVAVRLLFAEAQYNFTRHSLYPCEVRDVLLLASILLYLRLRELQPTTDMGRRDHAANELPSRSRSLSSHSRHQKPSRHDDKTASASSLAASTTTVFELRQKTARQFLATDKHLALIMPKQRIKQKASDNATFDWRNQILEKFLCSSFSNEHHSILDTQFRFLTLCWNLTLYGCAYFEVEVRFKLTMPYVPCLLAINDTGLYLMHPRSKDLGQNFRYPSIRWTVSTSNPHTLSIIKKDVTYSIKSRQTNRLVVLIQRLQTMQP